VLTGGRPVLTGISVLTGIRVLTGKLPIGGVVGLNGTTENNQKNISNIKFERENQQHKVLADLTSTYSDLMST
jgi:hypothetical protein